jgi:hypothetical protein
LFDARHLFLDPIVLLQYNVNYYHADLRIFLFIFQKTNPELAAEIIAEQEMSRTLERATLKHSKANRNKKLAFKTQVRTLERI